MYQQVFQTKYFRKQSEGKEEPMDCISKFSKPIILERTARAKRSQWIASVNFQTKYFRTHSEGKEEPDWGDWFMNVPRVS